ncbi:MAG: carbohydrate-binding family 9-like protein [Vicinamibacterales bacterium]
MTLEAARFRRVPELGEAIDADAWREIPARTLATTWRGDDAPAALRTTARLAWSDTHLWVAFTCGYTELDADTGPAIDVTTKRVALWERDVCEAFVWCPAEPRHTSYKEFEVAPTGQWCDLAIHEPRVHVDITWRSGMETAAAIDTAAGTWRAVMRMPFSAFGVVPAAGDTWRANLFRISRLDGRRQYLTYSPTDTPAPDFHVPAAFVPLVFA